MIMDLGRELLERPIGHVDLFSFAFRTSFSSSQETSFQLGLFIVLRYMNETPMGEIPATYMI